MDLRYFGGLTERDRGRSQYLGNHGETRLIFAWL
jgi:hypothetical protein